MAELGWVTAKLPTRGMLNLHPDTQETLIPDGEVQIRKLTTKEESILLSQGAQGLERLDILIKNCVKIPNGVHPKDLLLTDRMALVLALRTHTFGPHYSFNFKCQYCNQMSKYDLDIMEELEEHSPDVLAQKLLEKGEIDALEDFVVKDNFEIELPDSGDTVTLRFLRGRDDAKISSRSKRTMMQSNDPSDPSNVHRLALQIVAINGEKIVLAQAEIYAREMTSLDGAKIRIEVDKIEPGIDTKIYPTCRACGATNERGLPFSAEFFQPTTI